MGTHTTVEKMKQIRLFAMGELYHRSLQENLYQDHTADQLIALLVDTEWEHRHNNKIKNLIRGAGLSAMVSPNDIDYTSNRGLDKNTFERLLSLQFIKQRENLILTGPTGVGKSYLAQSIGHTACNQLLKTLYFKSARLMEHIKMAKLEGTYIKLLKKIQKAELLVIDDFGLHGFDNPTRAALMDIIEERHDTKATLLTSQIPVSGWHQMIGQGTIADAILDRLVYASHRIELSGESLRKKRTLKG